MEFERRSDDKWHLAAVNCGNGDTVHETMDVDPDDGFVSIDGTVRLHLPAVDGPTWCADCRGALTERYSQSKTPIHHWKVATTFRDLEWSDYEGAIDRCGWCEHDVETLVHETETDTLVCELCAVLYNSVATDPDDTVTITDFVALADEVEPVVVLDSAGDQQAGAKIDRRPYVSLKAKQKYVTVTITLEYTDYQFTEDAIERLREVFETYEDRASRQSDNKGGVDFDVPERRPFGRERPRQQIVVDGLFETDAREFIEDILPVVRDTSHWTYDPSTVDQGTMKQILWERGRPGPAPVPREGAPEIVVQDDGITRHVPLADKSITPEQIRAYVSEQAYRHGEALVDAGRIRVNYPGEPRGDADGYDARSGDGFVLWFEDGEIVDHECFCGSSLDPCEHVAGALLTLPRVAACYTGQRSER